MKIAGKAYRSIWRQDDNQIQFIDQTRLPFAVEFLTLQTLQDALIAITTMQVRGAPLIGATAAWGLYRAIEIDASDAAIKSAVDGLIASRPTAINLRWAVERVYAQVLAVPERERVETARLAAQEICDADVACCSAIGDHGLALIAAMWQQKQDRGDHAPLNILTHCNAGWLATVDWGTALAPIYKAHDAGIAVHVWVDETRPRNQGASLTAWELAQHGIPHTLIVDNAGGHLMQQGLVDVCIVGTDRTAANGDVCNKIGTYLKALAAADNSVPFYVALPSSTVDWEMASGVGQVPIEQRDDREVTHVWGQNSNGVFEEVRICPEQTPAANYAFDVCPARLVSQFITEHGCFDASEQGLAALKQQLSHSV